MACSYSSLVQSCRGMNSIAHGLSLAWSLLLSSKTPRRRIFQHHFVQPRQNPQRAAEPAFKAVEAVSGQEMDAAAEIYRCCPLEDAQSIRLLSVSQTEDFEAPLDCALVAASLDDTSTHYQTISYAWESQQRTQPIQVNGMATLITKNLFCALKRIRERESSPGDVLKPIPFIWTDALCINQNDDEEKSQQVAMMGKIYESSQRLLIWLGEASGAEIDRLEKALRCKDSIEERKDTISSLLGRTWFRRRWVIQEVFRSPVGRRHIMLGSHRFRLDRLQMPIMSLWDHYGSDFAATVRISAPILTTWLPVTDRRPDMNSHVNLNLRLGGAPSNHVFTMFGLLVRFGNAQCQLPVDIVYSLIGATGDEHMLKIDYEATLDDVLIAVAKNRSLRDPGSVLLCATAWRSEESSRLPSWVPDWSQPANFASQLHERSVYDSCQSGEVIEIESSQYTHSISGLCKAVDPLPVKGYLVRDCGHARGCGNNRCTKCGRNTQVWRVLVGSSNPSIFELHRQSSRSRRRNGVHIDRFQLKSYGGTLADEVWYSSPKGSSQLCRISVFAGLEEVTVNLI